MPTNFGLLQAIQPPSVIAQLPSTPANNSIDSLAGGLMQGVKDASLIQTQAVQRQGMIQDQQQSAQLFPSQLKTSEANATTAQVNAERAQQIQMDEKEIRAAAQQGVESYRNAIYKIDPSKGVAFDQANASFRSTMEDIKGKSFENYVKFGGALGNFAGNIGMTVAIAQNKNPNITPEQTAQIQQQAWDFEYKKASPEMRELMGTTYDSNKLMAAQGNSMNAIADYKARNPSSSDTRSTNQKDLQRQAELKVKLDSGQATKEEQIEYRGLTSNQTNQLRDEFSKATKPFQDVSDAYGRIQAAGKEPSAAGDLALIFNYMKMLDPGSTVREGEFATAQNSASIPERVRAMYNKVISGERLATEQRKDFLERSGKLYNSQKESYSKVQSDYTKRAERAGLDPQDVIVDYTVKSREDAASLKSYTLNGDTFDMEAAKKATGLSEEEIVKQAGLK